MDLNLLQDQILHKLLLLLVVYTNKINAKERKEERKQWMNHTLVHFNFHTDLLI